MKERERERDVGSRMGGKADLQTGFITERRGCGGGSTRQQRGVEGRRHERPGVAAGHQSLENGFVDATNPRTMVKWIH